MCSPHVHVFGLYGKTAAWRTQKLIQGEPESILVDPEVIVHAKP